MQDDATGLESRAKAAFDQRVGQLDAATRSRLTRARHAALAGLERPPARFRGWLPAGALAAAALLAVMLWPRPQPAADRSPVPLASTAGEDFELITSGDDLDMLDEDVEFYAWATGGNGNGNG